MKRYILAIAALSACSEIDKPSLTEFSPTEGGFTYTATTDPFHTLKGGEEERIRWLEEYLADNGVCPSGYDITERKVILTSKTLNKHDVRYSGVCL